MIIENRRNRAHVDWILIGLMMVMCLFGVFAVTIATFSAGSDPDASLLEHILGSYYGFRQIIFLVIAVVITAVMLAIPYDWLKRWAGLLFVVANTLLLFTLVANRATGVKAWLDILWGFTIQPSEFIKLTIILLLAKTLANDENPLASFKSIRSIAVVVGIPSLITVASGEMGSILVVVFLVAIMLFFAGTDLRILGGIAFVGVVAILALYAFLVFTGSDSYRLARILAFVNPEMYSATDAYQMQQSMMTIGSGGLYGIGTFVEGSMSQLNYVPADWTDFIFATIGEAFGFVGCSIVILMYLAMILRMLYLARYTRDRFGMLVICGVMGMLLFHVFENIGMTMGLMPITGIPLPFLSYGGSNIVTNVAGVGMVLNVTKNRSLSHSIATPQTKLNLYTYVHHY